MSRPGALVAAFALLGGVAPGELTLTHGAAVGEVTERSAVIWARAGAEAEMVLRYRRAGAGTATVRVPNAPEKDFTVRTRLEGLEPGTLYQYEIRFEAGGEFSETIAGSFRTAPSASEAAPLRFVVAGDLGGHGYCREESVGYSVFARMRELEPHFFVANGDMIYADSECPKERPDGGRNVEGDFLRIDDPAVDWTDAAAVREIYLAHWRYNRADESFQRFLLEVPIYVQWDDHEVINDFGARWPTWAAAPGREGFSVLVRAGREAIFDFNPLWPNPEEPHRIYRSFRWGRTLELFLLDARSYRSANDLGDTSADRKTLLGEAQLDWLKRALAASGATWKVVSSDVPLSIATGTNPGVLGRDAFASGDVSPGVPQTGFETELRDLLGHMDERNVKNVVFVVTDVHFATTLRYELDVDGDGDQLRFHELVSGPLSAGLGEPRAPDATFEPEVLYAEGGMFNFSFIRADESRLVSEIRDDTGAVRPGSSFTIRAEP